MKVKELITLLRRCNPEEVIYAAHGEIDHVAKLISGKCPSQLFLLSQEEYDDFIDSEWPVIERVKPND